ALESAHAGAVAINLARSLPKGKAIVVNMSGRGDKDLFITAPHFRPAAWAAFLERELEALKALSRGIADNHPSGPSLGNSVGAPIPGNSTLVSSRSFREVHHG
ncbi:MAG: hypothetical protein N2Z76_07070, partial [Treponemataceae bacterium]|nr:hypothetical protein [Treponemataceae bacterium]